MVHVFLSRIPKREAEYQRQKKAGKKSAAALTEASQQMPWSVKYIITQSFSDLKQLSSEFLGLYFGVEPIMFALR